MREGVHQLGDQRHGGVPGCGPGGGREPGYAVIAAEDFGASPGSPQQVCLAGVREADVVVLLLGARYGTPQSVRSVADS